MSLAKGGAILFISSMAGNLANYLFQFFMGKHLSVEDYGNLNAAFSILVIVAIPSTTIMLVMAKYTSLFMARGEGEKIGSLYRNSLVRMAALGLLFFLPFALFRESISGYLKMPSEPVLIIGAAVFLSFPVTVNYGILQGLQRFYSLGAGLGLTGVLKLVFGVALVVMGLGLNGAAASVAFSSLFVFAVTSVLLFPYYRKEKVGAVERNTKDIILYSVPVLLSTVAVTLITNVDVIFVKHYFPAREAGLYCAVSVLGKTVLYLPAAFVLALFPIVSRKGSLDAGAFKALDRALIYVGAVSAAGVIAFTLFPEFTVKTLFGERFLPASILLKPYGLAMLFMGVTGVLISFNLARGRTGFIYTLAAGCLMMAILLNLFHGSLQAVVFTITGVNFGLMAVNLAMVQIERLTLKKRRESHGGAESFYNYPG